MLYQNCFSIMFYISVDYNVYTNRLIFVNKHYVTRDKLPDL